MSTKYTYIVSMSGFQTVTGTCIAARSHDAEVRAVEHFAEANDIELQTNPNLPGYTRWSELIRFYAPAISYSSAR